jgi:hypothetical protein
VALHPRSDPIAGEVRLPDGSTTTFCGYAQLIAAVDRAHRGVTDNAIERARTSPHGRGR